MALGLDVQNVNDVAVIRLTGRIVLGDDLALLEQKITAALKESAELIINLSGVDFVDSSGLGALVRHVTAARARRKKISICGLTPHVRKVFDMTRVTDLFSTFATEEEALAAAGSAPRIAALHTPSGMRVLIVDESLDMLAYLRNTLQMAGYQVLTSSNFPDAQLFLKSAAIIVFGPNPVPWAQGSAAASATSVDALRKAAPQLPAVSIQLNEDSAAMADDLLKQVRAAAKDLK